VSGTTPATGPAAAHPRADDVLLRVDDLKVHFPIGGGLLGRPTA
jgi:hypothetical protein